MHCLLCPEDIFMFHNIPDEDIFSFAVCKQHENAPVKEIIAKANEIKSSWPQREIILYLAQIAQHRYEQYRAGDTEIYPNEESSVMAQIQAEIMAFKSLEALANDLVIFRDVLQQHKMYDRADLYNQMIFLVDSWGAKHLSRKYYRPPLASALLMRNITQTPHLFLQ